MKDTHRKISLKCCDCTDLLQNPTILRYTTRLISHNPSNLVKWPDGGNAWWQDREGIEFSSWSKTGKPDYFKHCNKKQNWRVQVNGKYVSPLPFLSFCSSKYTESEPKSWWFSKEGSKNAPFSLCNHEGRVNQLALKQYHYVIPTSWKQLQRKTSFLFFFFSPLGRSTCPIKRR